MYQIINSVFLKFGVHVAPFDEKIRVRHCCKEEESELL